jgi:hypothetical protein
MRIYVEEDRLPSSFFQPYNFLLERRGMHTGFWWESQKEINHYEDLDVSQRIILKFILYK